MWSDFGDSEICWAPHHVFICPLPVQRFLLITMETLSRAFNGGQEVSSLWPPTHMHTHTHTRRLFSGAVVIVGRAVGLALLLCTEILSPIAVSLFFFWPALPSASNHHWQLQSLLSFLLIFFVFSFFSHTSNLVCGKAGHLEAKPLNHDILFLLQSKLMANDICL